MKTVYVTHSTDYDYRSNLYVPIRSSRLNEQLRIVLPHERSSELFSSKAFFRDECDLVIAEISTHRFGVGIEMGWADAFNVPIIGLHQAGITPSRSAVSVCKAVLEYDSGTLVQQFDAAVSEHIYR